MNEDARQHAPSVARNRDPIWVVLGPQLPARGLVLEIASGSGEHTVHFARLAGPPSPFSRATRCVERVPASTPGRPRRG